MNASQTTTAKVAVKKSRKDNTLLPRDENRTPANDTWVSSYGLDFSKQQPKQTMGRRS